MRGPGPLRGVLVVGCRATRAIGPLSRHVPTREAPVEAVHRAELCTGVGDLTAASPNAAAAARTWMDRCADVVVTLLVGLFVVDRILDLVVGASRP